MKITPCLFARFANEHVATYYNLYRDIFKFSLHEEVIKRLKVRFVDEMDRPIPSEGGKTLLNTRKQDVLFGVGINAEDNKPSTAATYRISNAATVKSTNKGKDKSGHVVPFKHNR